jgi:hypothetical protein
VEESYEELSCAVMMIFAGEAAGRKLIFVFV